MVCFGHSIATELGPQFTPFLIVCCMLSIKSKEYFVCVCMYIWFSVYFMGKNLFK